MQIGWGQLIVVAIVLLLLFGNLSNISKDVGKAIQEFKTSFESKNNDKNNKES